MRPLFGTSASSVELHAMASPGESSVMVESHSTVLSAGPFTFQWERCNAAGTGCVPIVGATNATYQLAHAAIDGGQDDGNTVRVVVTGHGLNGDTPVASGVTGVVLFNNLAAPFWLKAILGICIVLANYLCALAGLTSTSRMIFAFARDGGLPGSSLWKTVSPTYRTPVAAIWLGCSS